MSFTEEKQYAREQISEGLGTCIFVEHNLRPANNTP